MQTFKERNGSTQNLAIYRSQQRVSRSIIYDVLLYPSRLLRSRMQRMGNIHKSLPRTFLPLNLQYCLMTHSSGTSNEQDDQRDYRI